METPLDELEDGRVVVQLLAGSRIAGRHIGVGRSDACMGNANNIHGLAGTSDCYRLTYTIADLGMVTH